MALFKNFSLSAWIKQFGRSCRRFPVSVLLLVFLTCFVLFLIHGGKVTDKWQFFEVPFRMMPPNEPKRSVTLENASTIRVTVWLENCNHDVTVWFGPIAASPDEADYVNPPTTIKIE